MKRNRSLVLGIILTVAAGFVAMQNWVQSHPETGTASPAPTFTSTPADPLGSCAYMWAYHDAPELTQMLNAEVAGLAPTASASASLYGEDCVYGDGHSTFGAMETDFYIHLPSRELNNEEFFGNWMAQILPILLKIPPEQIQGSLGFAEFWFEAGGTDHVIARVPLESYVADGGGQAGAELFRKYHNAP